MTNQLVGHIYRPNQRPEKVTFSMDRIKGEYDSVTVTTTAYTVKDKKYIFVDDDTAAGVVTVTLPPVIENTDRELYVFKMGTTANVTVYGNASETIDGATTASLTAQYQALHIICSGAEWVSV